MLTEHRPNLLADLVALPLGLCRGEALTLSTGLTLPTTLTLSTGLALPTTLTLSTGLALPLSCLGHLASPASDTSRGACAVLQLPGLPLVGAHELSLLVG
jgi:hypothetical protein